MPHRMIRNWRCPRPMPWSHRNPPEPGIRTGAGGSGPRAVCHLQLGPLSDLSISVGGIFLRSRALCPWARWGQFSLPRREAVDRVDSGQPGGTWQDQQPGLGDGGPCHLEMPGCSPVPR